MFLIEVSFDGLKHLEKVLSTAVVSGTEARIHADLLSLLRKPMIAENLVADLKRQGREEFIANQPKADQ